MGARRRSWWGWGWGDEALSTDQLSKLAAAVSSRLGADVAASPGSSSRQFAGNSPACATARVAAAAASSDANRTDSPARNVGRSCTRSHASTMTPSVPSEPRRSRSGDGPAPDPGSRRDSMTPAGVTVRMDSTKSSMCV
jgi:hypothetical protein